MSATVEHPFTLLKVRLIILHVIFLAICFLMLPGTYRCTKARYMYAQYLWVSDALKIWEFFNLIC